MNGGRLGLNNLNEYKVNVEISKRRETFTPSVQLTFCLTKLANLDPDPMDLGLMTKVTRIRIKCVLFCVWVEKKRGPGFAATRNCAEKRLLPFHRPFYYRVTICKSINLCEENNNLGQSK